MNPSEQAQQKATILYMVQTIVEKHGGTVDVDLATDTLLIDVPAEKKVACAHEIQEQAEQMGY